MNVFFKENYEVFCPFKKFRSPIEKESDYNTKETRSDRRDKFT